jgi:CheY-like chemotaxis protein
MNHGVNILVAEDNPDDVFLLRHAFKKAGASSNLHSVNDGMEALAYLKGQDRFSDRKANPFPDLLLLDINMPRMNGLEVLEWIRGNPQCSRLIVYMLTASSRESDVQRAHDLRANAYIVKPTRLDDLVTFVKVLHEWQAFLSLPYSLKPHPVR